MRQYENPTIELNVGAEYLAGMKDCIVTITANNHNLPPYMATYFKGDLTIDETAGTITFEFRSTDGAYFDEGSFPLLQVNILYEDGERIVSKPARFPMRWTGYKQTMR